MMGGGANTHVNCRRRL